MEHSAYESSTIQDYLSGHRIGDEADGRRYRKAQSSLELLVTLSFGLIILLPIVALAFLQISSSSSTLSATGAQQIGSKIATVAEIVGSQGPPARQLTTIEIPPGVQDIYVGTLTNGVGHYIIITISTTGGLDNIVSYTPVNVSGDISGLSSQGTYLLNISADENCPSDAATSCVYISPAYG